MTMERDKRRSMTLRVRHALELVGLEDEATNTINALAVRGLVVEDRANLMSVQWLEERLAALNLAASLSLAGEGLE